MSIHIMIMCEMYHWNPSTVREKKSRHAEVLTYGRKTHGQPDGRQDDPKTRCFPPIIVGGGIKQDAIILRKNNGWR